MKISAMHFDPNHQVNNATLTGIGPVQGEMGILPPRYLRTA